ncbi:DUF2271 domain-containing protein [Sphingomonas profundi]|uniref:DUF2271 domain-containing protein n=1 Tax=Alterirhizorhabdus profundi TaxID=2681549 RepID=UPI0012E74CA9|nr:DUF2271 domain-containing protein [Sphingomonas profundi]
MKPNHILALTAPLIGGLAASPALAAGIDLTVTIPQLKVAEYHRPYVAIYLEQPGQPVRNLALWYDADNREDGGRKWLTELRQWWRKSGRTLKLPADGITGATRAPGPQKISFAAGARPLGTLPPGQYMLVVEAAREVGGKEIVRLPFAWPAKTPQVVNAAGTTELGAVTATIKP